MVLGVALFQSHGFQLVGVLLGGASFFFFLEVKLLVPYWKHARGFHKYLEQTKECFTEKIHFAHLLNQYNKYVLRV